MGAAWVDHPSFELVALASEITGRDLAHLLLEADQETLTRTDNAQIATFVQSLIVLDAAERIGIEPSASAGGRLVRTELTGWPLWEIATRTSGLAPGTGYRTK